MFNYEVITRIPRNFDPDVEGVTIDSIVESCEGYVEHSVPLNRKNTVINIETSQELDPRYLTAQLDDNFKEYPEADSVVKEIILRD